MKRALAVVTAATLTVLAGTSPAQAAPKDPLAALRKQLVAGRGVTYTENSSAMEGNKPFYQRKGLLQYGKSGIVASDLTSRFNFKKDPDAEKPSKEEAVKQAIAEVPERTIRIGTTSYTSGYMIGARMPKGKSWWKQSPGWVSGNSAIFGAFVNAAEPATLKALLENGTRNGSTYEGEITVKELLRASAWTRAALYWGMEEEMPVSWTLTVDRNGLPQHLTAKVGSALNVADIRYTGWGAKVSVKAPPAAKVTTKLTGSGKPLPRGPKN